MVAANAVEVVSEPATMSIFGSIAVSRMIHNPMTEVTYSCFLPQLWWRESLSSLRILGFEEVIEKVLMGSYVLLHTRIGLCSAFEHELPTIRGQSTHEDLIEEEVSTLGKPAKLQVGRYMTLGKERQDTRLSLHVKLCQPVA